MVHCSTTVMVQSIHQPFLAAYTAQGFAPDTFVVLANVQPHETSEHQGRKPQSLLVALALTCDTMFVGSAIETKVRLCACYNAGSLFYVNK